MSRQIAFVARSAGKCYATWLPAGVEESSQKMCGIAGVLFDGQGEAGASLLQELSEPIHHRGPDDYGWCAMTPNGLRYGRTLEQRIASKAILTHRRLSILDLSEAGWQPMATPDGEQVIVHNGEIYNYLEIRAKLETLGYRFHSQTDTEVLLNGYAAWGLRFLQCCVGMFAFAILDLRSRKLVLVRDFSASSLSTTPVGETVLRLPLNSSRCCICRE